MTEQTQLISRESLKQMFGSTRECVTLCPSVIPSRNNLTWGKLVIQFAKHKTWNR